MDTNDIISYLRIGAGGLRDGSNLFLAQPALSRAMRIAGGLVEVAATLLERGHADPVEHVTRLVDLDERLNQARAEVDHEAAEQFK
jgi:hypothetical protein